MFTNSRSSYGFIQNLQNGRYDRHCLALSVLETIVFSALAIAFSCGMIACSTSTTPCTGTSCQNLANADGGASGSDGAASDDAGNDDETGNKAEAGGTTDTVQFPDFKNSVPQVCDFQNNLPAEWECLECKFDHDAKHWQGCGYKELNSPAGDKCTKNQWIKNVTGEWKTVTTYLGDSPQCCGYNSACGYGNKQSCDSEGVKPPIPHYFVVACQAESLNPAFPGCPDGFLFFGAWLRGAESGFCLLENGVTFSNNGSPKDSPYGGNHNRKGKLWWKEGILYAGFCDSGDFEDASRKYPCSKILSDGKLVDFDDFYHIYQKISN